MKKTYQLSRPTFSKGLQKLDKNTHIQILTRAIELKNDPTIIKPLRGDSKCLDTTKKTESLLLYVGHRKHIYQ